MRLSNIFFSSESRTFYQIFSGGTIGMISIFSSRTGSRQIGHLFLFARRIISHLVINSRERRVKLTLNANLRWWVWERKTLEQISSDDISYRLKVAGTHFLFSFGHGAGSRVLLNFLFWTRRGVYPRVWLSTSCSSWFPVAARCLASGYEIRVSTSCFLLVLRGSAVPVIRLQVPGSLLKFWIRCGSCPRVRLSKCERLQRNLILCLGTPDAWPLCSISEEPSRLP